MCQGMLGASQSSSPPSASLKAPSSVVPVETRVVPPAAVSSLMPHFQNALLRHSSLDHTTANQTNWWVKIQTYSEQTVLCSQSTLLWCRCEDLWFMWYEVWNSIWVVSWGRVVKISDQCSKTTRTRTTFGGKESSFSLPPWSGTVNYTMDFKQLPRAKGLRIWNKKLIKICICEKKRVDMGFCNKTSV